MRCAIYLLFTIFYHSAANSNTWCNSKTSTSSNEVEYTEQKAIKVSDIDDHFIRIFKTETNHKDSKKNCEGLKILKTEFFGMSDYIKKSGKVSGYSVATYNDNSKIFSYLEGVSHTPEDQNLNGVVTLSIKITGGSGIYKGIVGYGKGKTEFNPETGYSAGETETYYLIRN